jgi:predicted LPLAT superfamily acyltransferase
MAARRHSATETVIRNLARRHAVAYARTQNDALANHITRLAGDDVQLDEVEQLLIALQRGGHLSRVEAVRLQAKYLREARP